MNGTLKEEHHRFGSQDNAQTGFGVASCEDTAPRLGCGFKPPDLNGVSKMKNSGCVTTAPRSLGRLEKLSNAGNRADSVT